MPTGDLEVKCLGENHINELNALYKMAYPQNWFDQRMIQTGQYYGIFKDNMVISVAGIHVYSQKYKVAALGNITTHPEHRGKGYATLATQFLCKSLLDDIEHIGLNVKADNETAIAMYQKLGFTAIANFEECEFTL